MFTRAKRRALLKSIAPLAAAARAEREAKDAIYAALRRKYLDAGLTGRKLKDRIKKDLAKIVLFSDEAKKIVADYQEQVAREKAEAAAAEAAAAQTL